MYDSFAANFIEMSDGPRFKILRTGNDVKLFGVTSFERLIRQFTPDWRSEPGDTETASSYVILRDDTVYDPVLLEWLREQPGRALAAGRARAAHARPDEIMEAQNWVSGYGPKPESLHASSPRDIGELPDRNSGVHRTAYCFTPLGETELRGEQRLFTASRRGDDSVYASRLTNAPAFHMIRLLSRSRYPVSLWTLLFAAFAMLSAWFFWQHSLIAGTAAGLTATFLACLFQPLNRCLARDTPALSRLDRLVGILLPPLLFGSWYLGAGLATPLMLAALLASYAVMQTTILISRHYRTAAPTARWRSGKLLSLALPCVNQVLLLLLAGALLGEPAAALTIAVWWSGLMTCYILWQFVMTKDRPTSRTIASSAGYPSG